MPMAAILAHFTSIQSPVHHPMSRFNLLYAFIVYTLLLPRSTSCKINQTCGIIDIPYPFGLRGSGCGLSRFQIDCVEDVRPVIEIGSHNYTVLDFSRDSQTSRIVDDEYFQNCTSSYDIFDEIEDKSVFDRVDTYNITLTVLSCDTLCLLNGVPLPQLSCTLEKPTVLGGLAHWNYTNNALYQNCHKCESSGGWCGYNISDNGQFLCFCGNATHPNQCPQGKSSIPPLANFSHLLIFMALSNGLYTLRFVPKHVHLPFTGGVYATGEAINAPIRAEALNPSATGEQSWKVQAVDGKHETYTITYPGFSQPGSGSHPGEGHGPVIPGWGLGQKHRGLNEPVRLTVDIKEWIITQVDPENGVYQITEPASGMVGVVHAVTEEHGRLMVSSYPSSHLIQVAYPLPRWQFAPVQG